MFEKRSVPTCARLLGTAALAASLIAGISACSGGSGSQSALPPSGDAAAPAISNAPITTLSTTAPSYQVVQTAHAGGTYNSTVTVHLNSAPVAGHVLVLLFEQNKTSAFPYSGQVAWPTTETGSQWSYDGGTSESAVLHHVVQAGETGTYTLNVGGTGSGHEDYMVAEISGANVSKPVNARLERAVAAGTRYFTFGSGITPTAAGTFPVAFFTAHACCSGLSWSSISSGWTVRDRNGEYTEMVATGPVQTGTTTVNATATLSGGSPYTGAADVVLLNPATAVSTTTTSTPAPSTTATPAPAPTAAPVQTASTYTFHGCVVYGANDWFTTNLLTGGSSYVSNKVDPNSAAMVKNFANAFPGSGFNVNGTTTTVSQQYPSANLATNSTPLHTVQGTTMTNDPTNDDPNNVIPWQTGFRDQGNCTYDCHAEVVNTQTCVDYETYRWAQHSWNGSTYTAENGFVHNLNHPFNTQYSKDGGTVTKAGLPIIGTVDVGEDASLPSINHIAQLAIPGSDASSKAAGGYVAPATDGATCVSNCSYKIPFGARLRLNSSKYTCPSASYYPQAHKICIQLETYGAIVTDHNGTSSSFGIALAPTNTGANPWNETDVEHLNGIPITDFDIMTVGTIH